MIRLSRSEIRNIAANDTVYARGLQDYKDNHVLNGTWSNVKKQYRITIQDNFEHLVMIQVFEDGSFEHKCNCPDHMKLNGGCKHVVTALFFVLNYVERSLMEAPENPAEKVVYQILGYFSNQVDSKIKGETYHIKLIIGIQSILRSELGNAVVSIKVGNHHYYKVQSIKKFLVDIQRKEPIQLGKEFNFIPGESKFDKQSQSILNYFLQMIEIQEVVDKNSAGKLFYKSQLYLTKGMLLRLLDLLGDTLFSLELYGKVYEDVSYVGSNPPIKYDLSLSEDGVILDYHGKYGVIPVVDTGELLYLNHCIYKPTGRFLSNYLPFYNNLGSSKEPIIFKGVNKQKFLDYVLPKLSETMELTVPQELEEKFITSELKASIYLEKVKDDIQAELRYQYGTYEFNAFDSVPLGDFILVRQPNREDFFVDFLEEMGFQPKGHGFLLRKEEEIYYFLTTGIQELSKHCELFYSDDFKKVRIKTPGTLKTGLRVNTMNLLELDISYEDIPKEELKHLFHSMRIKKKFYRLKDGSFIDLEDTSLKTMEQIFLNLNATYKDMNQNVIELSKSTAFYLSKELEQKNIEVSTDKKLMKLIKHVQNPSYTSYKIPKEINAELRPYQVIGFQWLKTLAENQMGGILADDMGLGKTLQTIVYIASVKESRRNETFLIICPSSLIYNWYEEIQRFAPNLEAVVVSGTPKERLELIESSKNVDIFITSYPLLRRDIEIYEKSKYHTVFIDEAQYIKNADSLNAKSVKLLNTEHRFALTGTPIENSLSELWSIFDFIMPNFLFSHRKFQNHFEKPIIKGDKEIMEDLNKRIAPFILRRMKKEVLQELPDKIESKMLTEMEEEQKKVYLSYMEHIKEEIGKEIREQGYEKSKLKILAALTRMRQICCHPGTFIDNYTGGSGKLELLMDIVKDAIGNRHRILLFSQFTTMLDIIQQELKKENIHSFTLEGSTKIHDRNDYVKRFNEGEGDIFLISLKAGGTGLNLIGADMVIHYDPWWNPAVEDQATDRAYRIGQEKSVQVIKLITKGTIEEQIYKLQQKKKELSDAIISSQEIFINSLTKEELKEIFGV